jgi:hypothetical protein
MSLALNSEQRFQSPGRGIMKEECRNICTMVAYDDICNRVLAYNSLRQHMLTHVLAYARTHKCIPGAI